MSTQAQLDWFIDLKIHDQIAEVMGDYDDDHDYVGPEGAWTKVVPRSYYGVDMNLCGYKHDYKYVVGGTGQDRFYADAGFLVDMMMQIEIVHKGWWRGPLRHLARMRAVKYFEAVRVGGRKCFNHTNGEDNGK